MRLFGVTFWNGFLCCFLLILLSGCASVSVYDERTYANQNISVPEEIYIRPFKFGSQPFQISRHREELPTTHRAFAVDFHSKLLRRINENVLPARLVYPDYPLADPRVWVIDGEFVTVRQGNRALRSSIGLGLGGTKMQTFVTISQPDGKGGLRLIGSFQTIGGSNSEPGALFATPWGSLPRWIMSATTTGLTYDSNRTSRMIAAEISERVRSIGGKTKIEMKVKKRGETNLF